MRIIASLAMLALALSIALPSGSRPAATNSHFHIAGAVVPWSVAIDPVHGTLAVARSTQGSPWEMTGPSKLSTYRLADGSALGEVKLPACYSLWVAAVGGAIVTDCTPPSPCEGEPCPFALNPSAHHHILASYDPVTLKKRASKELAFDEADWQVVGHELVIRLEDERAVPEDAAHVLAIDGTTLAVRRGATPATAAPVVAPKGVKLPSTGAVLWSGALDAHLVIVTTNRIVLLDPTTHAVVRAIPQPVAVTGAPFESQVVPLGGHRLAEVVNGGQDVVALSLDEPSPALTTYEIR